MKSKSGNRAIRPKKSEAGFTLIEALIGLFIFTIGVLATTSMQVGALNGNTISRNLSLGANAGTNVIENLRPLDYMEDDNLTEGAHGPIQNGNYTITYIVQRDALLRNTMLVNVTVNWPYRGSQKSVNLVYIKHDTI